MIFINGYEEKPKRSKVIFLYALLVVLSLTLGVFIAMSRINFSDGAQSALSQKTGVQNDTEKFADTQKDTAKTPAHTTVPDAPDPTPVSLSHMPPKDADAALKSIFTDGGENLAFYYTTTRAIASADADFSCEKIAVNDDVCILLPERSGNSLCVCKNKPAVCDTVYVVCAKGGSKYVLSAVISRTDGDKLYLDRTISAKSGIVLGADFCAVGLFSGDCVLPLYGF